MHRTRNNGCRNNRRPRARSDDGSRIVEAFAGFQFREASGTLLYYVRQRRRRASGGPRSKLEVVLLVLDRSKRIAVGITRARGSLTPLPLSLSLSRSLSPSLVLSNPHLSRMRSR